MCDHGRPDHTSNGLGLVEFEDVSCVYRGPTILAVFVVLLSFIICLHPHIILSHGPFSSMFLYPM